MQADWNMSMIKPSCRCRSRNAHSESIIKISYELNSKSYNYKFFLKGDNEKSVVVGDESDMSALFLQMRLTLAVILHAVASKSQISNPTGLWRIVKINGPQPAEPCSSSVKRRQNQTHSSRRRRSAP